MSGDSRRAARDVAQADGRLLSRIGDRRIAKIVRLLMEAQGTGLSLDDLAERSHLSLSRLSHLFKHETGSSLRDFAVGARLTKARRLLESSDLSVKQIAGLLDVDVSHLSRQFAAAFGQSPRRYRPSLPAPSPTTRLQPPSAGIRFRWQR